MMSDTMLHGVLNMPIDVWGDSDLDKIQRASAYQEASEIIKNSTPNAKILELIKEYEGLSLNTVQSERVRDDIVYDLKQLIKPEGE